MIKAAAIFSDNMVLQRGKKVAVWGTADKGIVEVRVLDIAGNVVSDGEIASSEGSFMLFLPAMQAGGPYKMVISSDDCSIEFNNIMVGEVFLAGGQSNMELELRNSQNGEAAVAAAEAKNVRFYYTPKHAWVGEELYAEEEESAWELCLSENCGRWSAVAYYAAKKLSEELGVTVGVIGCNWGGTSASCWMSWDYLKSKKELESYVKEYEKAMEGLSEEEYIKAYEAYVVYQAEFDKNVGLYYQTCPNPSWDEAISLYGENQYPGPMGPRNWTRPCGLYESMVSRVAPYTLNGFWFYQGEEDDHKPNTYKLLLETLIAQWRHDWRDDSLSFMIVQLPVFLGEGGDDFMNWPLIREAQMDVYKETENTGLAVTLELGDKLNIHPLDKKSVGDRLAEQTLFNVYGYDNAEKAFAPMYCGCAVEEDKLYISFDSISDKYIVKGDTINNFEIAGEDKKYYPANATIEGDLVVLASEQVKEPKYARYAWRNYCEINFFGENGLPVAPFRTSREDGSTFTGSRNGLMV